MKLTSPPLPFGCRLPSQTLSLDQLKYRETYKEAKRPRLHRGAERTVVRNKSDGSDESVSAVSIREVCSTAFSKNISRNGTDSSESSESLVSLLATTLSMKFNGLPLTRSSAYPPPRHRSPGSPQHFIPGEPPVDTRLPKRQAFLIGLDDVEDY